MPPARGKSKYLILGRASSGAATSSLSKILAALRKASQAKSDDNKLQRPPARLRDIDVLAAGVSVRRVARALWAVAALAAGLETTGCTPVPDAGELLEQAERTTPGVLGPGGVFSYERVGPSLGRLRQDAAPTDLLGRHLAVSQTLSGAPLIAGNRATLVTDGPEILDTLIELVRRAQRQINAEFFIIDADGIGAEFGSLLIEKRRQGVEVNLIYDSIGSMDTPGAYFDRLREAGVRVLEVNPINPLRALPGTDWSLNRRDHRKMLIIDGQEVLTGGFNVSTVYAEAGSPRQGWRRRGSGDLEYPWRETAVHIDGPAVAEFQRAFLEQWRARSGPDFDEARFFPPLMPVGEDLVRVVTTSPREPLPSFFLAFMSALENAERSIAILQAYFVPTRQEIEALKRAVSRGVDVRLVLPKETDHPKVVYASRAHYSELLKAGVQIFERRGVLLHAKAIVIDGVWSVVGSSNLDFRSKLHNDEIDTIVIDLEFGREMQAMLARDVAQSERVDLSEWRNRSTASLVKEWFANLFEYWL